MKYAVLPSNIPISHNENTKESTKLTFRIRLVDLTHVKFSNDQINTLNVGFDYAIEKNPKQFINALLIDTENAIRHLDIGIQHNFGYLTTRKIEQFADKIHVTYYIKDTNIIYNKYKLY